jgi:cholesterol transport system auxiliary component
MSRGARWATVALAIGLLNGCGAGPPIKYFRLTVSPDAAKAERAEAFPVTLLVGSLTASHVYRGDRIVYGNGQQQMGTYQYQRWADPPTEMIEEVLLRSLRASGRYRAVYSQRSSTQGDYALRGRLQDFQELTGSRMSARVTLELEMRDLKTGATVWTHDYTHDEPVDGKDVLAVAAALDRNAQRGVSEMLASLDQYFASGGSQVK